MCIIDVKSVLDSRVMLLGTYQPSILSSYDAAKTNVVLIQLTKLNKLSIKIAISCSKSDMGQSSHLMSALSQDWDKAVTVLQK